MTVDRLAQLGTQILETVRADRGSDTGSLGNRWVNMDYWAVRFAGFMRFMGIILGVWG